MRKRSLKVYHIQTYATCMIYNKRLQQLCETMFIAQYDFPLLSEELLCSVKCK